MIYKALNKYEFVQAFDEMNRAENFSVAAREVLFDYYEDMSDAIGEPVELDVIAVCCDWAEFTADELIANYGGTDSSLEDVLEDLGRDQFVISVPGPDTYLVPN